VSRNNDDRDDMVDVTLLSLTDRARLAALAELDGGAAVRSLMLGAIGHSAPARASRGKVRELPSQWTQIHVLDRLEEAFEVMAMMPAATRPKSFGAAWPKYAYDRFDLNAQLETAELEKTLADRNKVRLSPTAAQVSRMDQALRWPFEYLSDQPDLARALSLRCFWAAMRADIRKRCAARGIDHGEFNAAWQNALRLVTMALIARKVPVT